MEGSHSRRMPALPRGWYPDSREEVEKTLASWIEGEGSGSAIAVVSPHAGWKYSGRLAAKALRALRSSQTIAVVGGHLGYGDVILCAREEGFSTPAGIIEADKELLGALESELKDSGFGGMQADARLDNSVEVILPMIPVLHPGAKILWLRSPPRAAAKELGAALGRAAAMLGRTVGCVGSTDLTHYGPAYGFTPHGTGPKAREWARNVNDKGFVSALLAMNCESALAAGVKTQAACSPGAAVSALSFALESGATAARLIGYASSLDVADSPSFVGYAALAFEA